MDGRSRHAKANIINDIYDKYIAESVEPFTRESMLWWKNVMFEMFGSNEILYATPGEWIRGLHRRYGSGRVTSKLTREDRGQMFMFRYNPKPRQSKKLKHWDALPISIVLDLYPDGFLGLNFHYLNHRYRGILLHELSKFLSVDVGKIIMKKDIGGNITKAGEHSLRDAKTLFRTYDSIKGRHRLFKYAKPCIKRYKYNSITSRVFKIPAVEWELMCHLPSDRFFVGDSRKKAQSIGINTIRTP